LAGSAPKNSGVDPVSSPSTTVKLSDTWCPARRQLHVPVADGVPKMRRKYINGSRPRGRPKWTVNPS
jgi:hypothetical protein